MRAVLLLLILLMIFPYVAAAPCGGVVECDCGDVIMNNYTMTSDLDCSSGGDALIIGNGGIFLDCAGFTITGDRDPETDDGGVLNSGKDYVAIRGCDISGFNKGIVIQGIPSKSTRYNSLEANQIHNNVSGDFLGVYLYYVDESIFEKNRFFNNKKAMDFSYSDSNSIIENDIIQNDYGLWFDHSDLNNISFNNISSNLNDGILAWWSSDNNTFFKNSFWNNLNNSIVITNTDPTEEFGKQSGCSWNLIDSNDIMNTTNHGILLSSSFGTTVHGNYVEFSGADGIFIYLSLSNIITDNKFVNSSGYGIRYLKSESSISSNIVCENDAGDFSIDAVKDNSGLGNTCDNPGVWNDTGFTNCTYSCFLGPRCSDNTPWNHCSWMKPMFCQNNELIHRCSVCGCPDARLCDAETGFCYISFEQGKCADGTEQGECSENKPLFCNQGVLENNCDECGCSDGTDCNSTTGICSPSCDDGTPLDHCSATQPGYCLNSTLVDACGSCGCNNSSYCDASGISCNPKKADDSPCDSDVECFGGNCFNDLCRSAEYRCDTDSDCLSEEYCSDGFCNMKKNVGGNCTADNHCSSGHCFEGDCVECIVSTECDSGEKCEGYVCVRIAVLSEHSQLTLGILTAIIVVIAMAVFVTYTRRGP